MKVVILYIAVLMLTYETSEAQPDLQITIRNIREIKGQLMVGLFDNANDFPKTVAVGKLLPVTTDSASVVFSDVHPGTYAISVIHDANGNGELDTNFLGIPTEGFAFGNNAMGAFGPPAFKCAQVTIKDLPVKQILILKYF